MYLNVTNIHKFVTMERTHTVIEQAIIRKKAGELVFPGDFRGLGTDDAIRKAFSRLYKDQKISRLAQGIYYIPKIDPVLGELRPGADEVVQKLADREKIRIRPTGATALHRLGLTTQVPTRLVYMTDGHPRLFKLGKLSVKLKPTTAKKLSTKGKISSLLIPALEELGTDRIDPGMEEKIQALLAQEDPKILKHDLALAPAKINDYIVRLLKKTDHDRMVDAHQGATKSND